MSMPTFNKTGGIQDVTGCLKAGAEEVSSESISVSGVSEESMGFTGNSAGFPEISEASTSAEMNGPDGGRTRTLLAEQGILSP